MIDKFRSFVRITYLYFTDATDKLRKVLTNLDSIDKLRKVLPRFTDVTEKLSRFCLFYLQPCNAYAGGVQKYRTLEVLLS